MESRKENLVGAAKNDFFPEESFQSWGNYGRALRDTKERLKDRIFTRSVDELELQAVRARSQNEMKKNLNWFDIIWFGIGAVMGAGVFVLTGQAAREDAGPAILISYVISGVAALLSVLCYTELAIELPVAGGSFAYLRVELGDFVAFIGAGNILFEYVVSGASVARSWTSYFATLCNHSPNDFRINISAFSEDYSHLDPIAVVVSAIICAGAVMSIKGSSRFNAITSVIHLVALAFIVVAGLTKADVHNVTVFAPFGVRGIFKASAMLFFAYVGFDGVATLGEEVKNPGRDIPVGLIGSMVIVIVSYCLLALTLCLMQPYTDIDPNAAFSIAFQAVGMDWAKYIVALGALQGMTTVLLANIIAEARYFTHIARTHMAPPILSSINKRTGTPITATVIMTIANCIVGFFTSLDVLSNLLSIATLFIFSLVALALLVRRYYVPGVTSNADRVKLVVLLAIILLSSIALSLCWGIDVNGWIPYVVIVAIWFAATLCIQVILKSARQPKVWATPLVPWLPSASIAINVFILGSIDGPSFVRFAVWTGILLVYYLFIGLHASYDAAKEQSKINVEISLREIVADGGSQEPAAAAVHNK